MKRKFKKHIVLSFVLGCCLSAVMIVAHAASYEITFRGGLNGTVEGKKSVTYTVEENGAFPDEPQVEAKDGYVFVGWNKQLPEVGAPVTGREVYVARYAAVVSGVRYTVHYVNELGNDIATQRTMLAEAGNSVVLRAKTIPGYESTEKTMTVTVDEAHHIFKFTYKLVDESAVQPNDNNQQTQQGAGNAAAVQAGDAQNNGDTDQNNGNNNEKQQETEKETENKTPLAGLFGKDGSNLGYIGAGVGCVLVLLFFLLWKKKKKEKAA